MKNIKLICQFFLVAWFFSANVYAAVNVVARAGKGALLEQEGRRVMLLQGSPFEMGYQHGRLLKEDIGAIVETVLAIANSRKPGELRKAWETSKEFIPLRYIEEMEGISAGSGIPFEKIVLANIFPELFHCSAGLFFGEATKDGEMYHVRVLDYMTGAGLQDRAVVKIFRPDGYKAFMSAGFAGIVGSVTGMNQEQIAIGEMGGGLDGLWEGIPMTFLIRMALEESASLDETVNIFREAKRTCEFYYLISDGKISSGLGLYCSPDKFEIFVPGAKDHPMVPEPMPEDTILMSGPSRYKVFRERVLERYGEIDAGYLKEIIKRPVAMESNLHNAIFIPADLKMYLAVASSEHEKFQACCQDYHVYDFNALTAYFQGGESFEKGEEAIPSVRYPKEPPASWGGMLKREDIKPFSPLYYEELQQYLLFYNRRFKDINYTVLHKDRTVNYDRFEIVFPSIIKSSHKVNNDVYIEYYRTFLEGERPVVLLLDIQDGSMVVPRLIAEILASRGINSGIVTLPYYNRRKPEGVSLSGQLLLNAFLQGVQDIRVSANLLVGLSENREDFYLCGVSFGGIAGALASGVDGNFKKVALLLAGGNLPRLLENQDGYSLPSGFEAGLITALLDTFDPLTYAKRMKHTYVLMINAEDDEIVPAISAEEYYAMLTKKDIHWYPGGHYSLQHYLPEVLGKIADFFAE